MLSLVFNMVMIVGKHKMMNVGVFGFDFCFGFLVIFIDASFN